jgi:DNA-binding NtrC family response regulator
MSLVGGTLLILSPGSASDEPWTPDLEDLGYTVLYAEEPIQALVHVRTARVDCVLINTPTEACESVTEFVQTLTKELQAPPFVLVSSSPSAPTYSAKLGAAAFVPKPCCADELEHVLARMSVKPPRAATASS